MKVIEKKLSEIKPYENNPRNNEDAVQYVANSLKKFGWKQPIVIDKDGVIVAGHTRYAAAKQLGMKTAPCVILFLYFVINCLQNFKNCMKFLFYDKLGDYK